MPAAAAPPCMGDGDTLLNAVIGAAVTVVLSFTGFSPLLGGGVAGYLQRGDRMEGARVGAISGALASIPFVLLLVFVFGFFGVFLAGGAPAEAGFGLVIVLVVFVLALVWNIGLGAAGGYLGVYVLQEFEDGRAEATR
jgi:hypothetical protein